MRLGPLTLLQLDKTSLVHQHMYITCCGLFACIIAPGASSLSMNPLPICIKTLQGCLTNCLSHRAGICHYPSLSFQFTFLPSCGIGNDAYFRQPSKNKSLLLDDIGFQIASAVCLDHPLRSPALCQKTSVAGRTCSQPLCLIQLSYKLGAGISLIPHTLALQVDLILAETGTLIHGEMPIPELNFGVLDPLTEDDCFDPLEIEHSRDAAMDVVAFCSVKIYSSYVAI